MGFSLISRSPMRATRKGSGTFRKQYKPNTNLLKQIIVAFLSTSGKNTNTTTEHTVQMWTGGGAPLL